jgi:hypothetical protein
MQPRRSTLTWAYVFFWCAALSVVVGFWGLARSATVPAGRLVPGAIFSFALLAVYVGTSMLMVRRLPAMSLAAARQSILMLAGTGLFLASMLLNLR